MVKVYGCSDDLVEIEWSGYAEDEIGCYGRDVKIRFTDGTVIRVGYPKSGMAVWFVSVEKPGTAERKLTICNDEDEFPYSDVFEIDAEIKGYSVVRKEVH